MCFCISTHEENCRTAVVLQLCNQHVRNKDGTTTGVTCCTQSSTLHRPYQAPTARACPVACALVVACWPSSCCTPPGTDTCLYLWPLLLPPVASGLIGLHLLNAASCSRTVCSLCCLPAVVQCLYQHACGRAGRDLLSDCYPSLLL